MKYTPNPTARNSYKTICQSMMKKEYSAPKTHGKFKAKSKIRQILKTSVHLWITQSIQLRKIGEKCRATVALSNIRDNIFNIALAYSPPATIQ